MKIFNYLLSATMICFSANTFAQTTGIDLTFGNDGIVTTDLNGKFDDATDIVVTANGDILVAGNSMVGSHYEFAVTRYHSDGSFDDSFGDGGIATIEFSTFHCMIKAMAVQEDGKIIVVGNYDNNYYTDPVIARFNSNGSVDTSFGGTGYIKFDLSAQFDDFNDVVIQPDGKILVAGSSYKYGTDDFLLVRFLENGSLDEDFGTDGFVYTDFDDTEDIIYSVLLQADHKIVVSGYSGYGSVYFAAARYYENGLLDPSFSIDGKVTLSSGSTFDKSYGMAMQSDSSFILAGNHHAGAIDEHMIARIDKYGLPDISFGTGGIVTMTAADPADLITDVIIQPDDKIVLSGKRENMSAFIRLTKNGTPDNSFGTDGIIIPDPEFGAIQLNAMAFTDDNTIIGCGSADQDDYTDFMLMKINVDVLSGIGSMGVANYTATVYPNPVTDHLTIESGEPFGQNSEITISDMNGGIVYRSHYSSLPAALRIELPDNIPAGTYIINVISHTGKATAEFQVIK